MSSVIPRSITEGDSSGSLPMPSGRLHRQHGQGIHTLRHAFAPRRLAAGIDPRTRQRLRGHRSLGTTTRSLRLHRTPLAHLRRPFALLRVDTLPPRPGAAGHVPAAHPLPPSARAGILHSGRPGGSHAPPTTGRGFLKSR